MKKCITFIILIAAFLTSGYAQKGVYINPFGGYQYSTISNYQDYRIENGSLNYEKSFYPSFGVNVVFNTLDIFGVETGLKYSMTGQNYSGTIDYDKNINQDVNINYTSGVKLKYLEIPFLIRFNSTLDEEIDNTFLTISAGFQLEYLIGADMNVDPFPTTPTGIIQVKQLYNPININFYTCGIFSFKVSDKFFINSGFQVSRSIFDVENKDFNYSTGSYPVEYYFPVSTKKTSIDNAFNNFETRKKTRILNYGIILGVSYQLKSE